MPRFGPQLPELNIRQRSQQIGEMPVADQSRAWAQVQQSFARMGRTLADRAADAAAREGEQAGLKAGIDPNFNPKRDGTIRGEAFDRAGLRTMYTRTETRLIESLAELNREHPDDGAAFNSGVDQLRKTYIDPLPAEIKADVAQSFTRQTLGYQRDYARLEAERLDDQARAEALPAIEARGKDLGRVAYSSGLDEAADKAIEGEMSALASLLVNYGPKTAFTLGNRTFEADEDRAGILGVEDIQAQLLEAGEAVALNRVKGTFDRLDSPASRKAFAEDFRKDYSAGGDMTQTMDLKTVEQLDRYFDQAVREDERAAREAQAEQRAAIREERADVRGRLGDFKTFARNGMTPDPVELSALKKRAIAIGDEDLVAEADRIVMMSEIVDEAGKRSPAETRAQITAARQQLAGGASPEQADAVLALERGLTRTLEGLSRDPVGFAIEQGVAPDIPFEIDGNMEAAMLSRAERAGRIEARYGVEAGLFNQAEKEELARVEAEDPSRLAPVAAAITEASGAGAFKYLADVTDDAPMLAQMGALLASGGSRKAVQDASKGMQLVKDNPGVTKNLTATTSGELARERLAPLQALPDDRARVERFANSIYLGRVGLNQDFDSEAYERALEEAMGATFRGPGRVKFGGTARVNPSGWYNETDIVVPSWLRADMAGDVLESLSEQDYRDAGGVPRDVNGEPIPMKDLAGARPVTVGDGVYRLILAERNGRPQYAAGDYASGYYELDLNALKDRIATRMPEAVSQ